MSLFLLFHETPFFSLLMVNQNREFLECIIFQLKTCETKAELLLLKLIHLFAREVLLVKKLEIEETKTT